MSDPKATGTGVDADGPALPAVPKNEQFASLNRLRRERTWVDVFLIGGTCLHGQIRSFDASMMLLQTRTGDIGLYHHAISTVVRAQKRGGSKQFKARPAHAAHAGQPPDLSSPPDLPDLQEPVRRAPDRAPVVIVKKRRTAPRLP